MLRFKGANEEAALKTLMTLVNKSLLRRDPVGRYEVHELLRQYGENQRSAEESEQIHDLHSAYFAEFLGQRWNSLTDRRQKITVLEIQTELDNCRYAWGQWSADITLTN